MAVTQEAENRGAHAIAESPLFSKTSGEVRYPCDIWWNKQLLGSPSIETFLCWERGE